NPSQIAPGSAHRAVTQPRSRASPASSARTRARSCAISSSASSTSARTRSAGSGAEELCILLLPDYPDLVALAPAEVRVALAGDLREHALAAGGEMELDEVAEELDEEDLALRGVRRRRGGILRDLDGCGAHRDERLVADGAPAAGGEDARPDVVLVRHDESVALDLDDAPTDDVVVAHEAGDELGLRLRGYRQRIRDLLDARIVHHDDAIGHRKGLFLVVRHVDEHQAELALEVAQLHAHSQLQEPVEVAERLVEQQRLRLRDEHARQCHTLLLTAR